MKKKPTKGDVDLAAINAVFKKDTPKKKITVKGKKKREVLKMDKPFDTFIALCIMQDVIKEEQAKLARTFKGKMFETFYHQMLENGEKPDASIVAEGYEASALYTMKRKGVISDALAEKLKKLNIPVITHELASDGLMLNPEIMVDQVILTKLAKAIQNIPELKAEEIFIAQDPVYSYKCNDETIASVLEANLADKAKMTLIKSLTSLAMSQPKLAGGTSESESTVERALQILTSKGVFNFSLTKKRSPV